MGNAWEGRVFHNRSKCYCMDGLAVNALLDWLLMHGWTGC